MTILKITDTKSRTVSVGCELRILYGSITVQSSSSSFYIILPSTTRSEPVDLTLVPDPWAKVSDEDAMTRIKDEDWEVIEAIAS